MFLNYYHLKIISLFFYRINKFSMHTKTICKLERSKNAGLNNTYSLFKNMIIKKKTYKIKSKGSLISI